LSKIDPSPELAECSSCGAKIPTDAKECPQCGEIFSPELLQEAMEASSSRRRERLVFYLGLLFVILGGPGMALGSLLHDVMRVPVLGSAYDDFGWLNRTFAAIGLVILIVGVVFLMLSARFTAKYSDTDYDIGTPRRT